jgi:lysophospholipase L1-like esterase
MSVKHALRAVSTTFLALLVGWGQGVVAPVQAVNAPAPLRVMAVGDSITQGSAGDFTWRYRLWQLLGQQSVSVELVGPDRTLLGGSTDYADPNFPTAHDAAWARRIADEAGRIADQVAAFSPDVLLVMLGANDLISGTWQGGAGPANLTALAANARSARADVALVVSELPPSCSDDYERARPQANAELRATVDALSTAESPAAVASIEPSYAVLSDTYDCIHPSPTGEMKIAVGLVNGLAALAFAQPISTPPLDVQWPAAPATVQVSATVTDVTVAWSPVPGATGYYVHRRDAGSSEFAEWSGCTAGLSWTAPRPAVGIDVAVAATKGTWTGASSSPVWLGPMGSVLRLVAIVHATDVHVRWSMPTNTGVLAVLVQARPADRGRWRGIGMAGPAVRALRWVPTWSGPTRIRAAALRSDGANAWTRIHVHLPPLRHR